MKKYGKFLLIIGIIVVICNIVIFAIPLPKTATFWISDAFVILSLVSLIPVNTLAFGKADTENSKFYGFPIMRIGILYVVSILICAVGFIIISFINKNFPVWLPIVVYVVLSGVAAIGLIVSDGARNHVEQQDMKTEKKIFFMRQLYAETISLIREEEDAKLVSALTELAEKVRYSDPVSSFATERIEMEISDKMKDLRIAVKSSDKDKGLILCRQITEDLIERNIFCKANKGRTL